VKRKIKYAAINSLLLLAMYYGFYHGVEGAANIALFFVWLSGIGGILILFAKDETKDKLKEDGPSVPVWVASIITMIEVCALLFYGHILVALVLVIGESSIHSIYKEGNK